MIRQRNSVRLFLALALALAAGRAAAWGQVGHSAVAEIAERRLSPAAAQAVERVLGRGHSLASVSSWADDVRETRPETYDWHFVDIPIAASDYSPGRDCRPKRGGDCIVAELDRLKGELRCAKNPDALRFAVHFVADLHQPLHTVEDERGGNGIPVVVHIKELKCKRCKPHPFEVKFHELWDATLIDATVWSWGTYVDRLERGWLRSHEARADVSGTPADWALETHRTAQQVWNALPADRVVDDRYYKMALPIIDQQLGLAGLRLAAFLNDAYSQPCSRENGSGNGKIAPGPR